MKILIFSLFILIPISSQAWLANAPFKQKHLQLVAGTPGGPGNADGVDSVARFDQPAGVAVDSSGNVYVADTGYVLGTSNHTIRKISPTGFVTTLAGLAGVSGTADGTGTAARFNFPYGIAVDSSGTLYVADTSNHTIRKITPAGVVTTLAGSAGLSGSANGTGSVARFNSPRGITVDSSGHVYVADTSNHTIRKITPAGVVTTFAGTAGSTGSTDATSSLARFNSPYGITVDSSGNLYVTDSGNQTIRKITSAAVVTTFAGTAGSTGSANGTAATARFDWPMGITVDSSGNVFVGDTGNHTIRKITSSAVVTTLSGTAGSSGSADGASSISRFYSPVGVSVDSSGNVYVADLTNHSIRKVTSAGVATTFAGLALKTGSTDGIGSAVGFNFPKGLVAGASGVIYVVDQQNYTIRKVTADGTVSTFAGTAGASGSTDAMGSAARFNLPVGAALDSAGNLYITDMNNHTIRKITSMGVVTTLAGTAGASGSADGTGATARFNYPSGVAVDNSGNVYVTDTENHIIRKITSVGAVTTLAGTAGSFGSADGSGSAARFHSPLGVAVDSNGNVYVTDNFNYTIRKITPAGVVTTFAGTAGLYGYVDGTGATARFSSPNGIAIDSAGNIFVTDDMSHTVRKITSAGVVKTLVGQPDKKSTSLGSLRGILSSPIGIAVRSGKLYITTENCIVVVPSP